MLREARVVYALSIVAIFLTSGNSSIVPNLPLLARSFGANDALIGLLIAAFGITKTLFDIPAGAMAQAWSAKRLLLLSILLTGMGALLQALAPSYLVLLSGRLVEGIGLGFYFTIALTVMGRALPSVKRARMMSLYASMVWMGATTGPIIGGYMGELYGIRAPFLVYASLAALGLLWTLYALRGYVEESYRDGRMVRLDELLQVLRDRELRWINLGIFSAFFLRHGIITTAAPLFAYDNLGMSPSLLGAILSTHSLMTFMVIVPAGYLSDRIGRKPLVMASLLSMALVASLIPYSSSFTFWALMASLGAAYGSMGPKAAWSADVSPKALMGASMGLYKMITDSGILMGPLAMGLLIQLTRMNGGVQPLPFHIASFLVLALALPLLKVRDPVGIMRRRGQGGIT